MNLNLTNLEMGFNISIRPNQICVFIGNPDYGLGSPIAIEICSAYGVTKTGERLRRFAVTVLKSLPLLPLKIKTSTALSNPFTVLSGGAVDEPNFSHILGRTKPNGPAKISILERRSDCKIRNSITVDVTEDSEGASKLRSGIFWLRIAECLSLESL